MNDLLPFAPPPVLAAILLVLPFLSLYVLWRIHRSSGSTFLHWNRVPSLPFSIFEMLVILALIALCLQLGLILLLPVMAVTAVTHYARKHSLSIAAIWGIDFSRLPTFSRYAFNSYLALLLPLALVTTLSFSICEKLGYTQIIQPVAQELMTSSKGKMLLLVFLASVLAPLWEELVFRGTIYPWLKAKLPQNAAILVSALFFAAIHQHVPSFLPLAMLGIALALVYEYSGSLIPSFLLHALFNFATCLNLLFMRPA